MLGISFQWPMFAGLVIAMLGSAGVGGLFRTWLDHKRGVRKQTDDVSISLVHEMRERMAMVETGANLDRDRAAEERARAERRERLCDLKLGFEHHRVNNLLQLNQSQLFIMQLAPEKLPEAIEMLAKRRSEQENTEATERAAILAFEAKILGLDGRDEEQRAA